MGRLSGLTLALVIAGGAAGVALRAVLTVPLLGWTHPLVVPAVTLVINVAGSFLLGVVAATLTDRHERWRALLGTGVLGGFTTYSAFAVQTVQVSSGSPVVALLLAVVALFGGLIAARAGLSLGRRRRVPAEAAP